VVGFFNHTVKLNVMNFFAGHGFPFRKHSITGGIVTAEMEFQSAAKLNLVYLIV
jgi:hypothetical protein